MTQPGQIILLIGVPRSGKSSIARAIQDDFDGVWMNLGVDGFMRMTPERYLPGIGLRPGGERPDLETVVERLYFALYDSIAAHSRLGINVVTDLGHHDSYSRPLEPFQRCIRRLEGLPLLTVAVKCPVEEIRTRRLQSGMNAEGADRWHEAVACESDMEVDTSVLSPKECAELIGARLQEMADDSSRDSSLRSE